MHNLLIGLVATSVLGAPAHAANWQGPIDSRPGAFVGARVQVPLGGAKRARPSAALAIAPTRSQISADGLVRTRIGDGLAFNTGLNEKPSLTLAGVRADKALGLQRRGRVDPDQRLGLSTGGWIAVGVGAALLAGAAAFYIAATDCPDNADECG